MDFNTGGSGTGGAPPPTQTGGRMPAGGQEFTLSDPVGSFIATVRGVVLSPVSFFRGIRRSGDFVGPIVFALVCSVISGVLGGTLGLLSNVIAGNGVVAALVGFFGTIVLTPLVTLVGLFIGAGIYHLIVMLLIKPNAGFEGSLRVVAYSSVVQLVAWIPLLGGLLALYSVMLAIFGMREAHGSSTGRAVAVVLIPTVVLLLVVLLFFAALLAVLFSATRGA